MKRMKKMKKAMAALTIAGMVLTMMPFNASADETFPTRISGRTAVQTAVAIAEQTGWTGTAMLASSTSSSMVDALTASPLATFLKAPILLTEAGNVLNADTKAELTTLKVKTVYVTSGTAVISQEVLDELTSMGITVVPLGGSDRFQTAVNIAKKMIELGAPVNKAAVVFGWTTQDALSIASIASAQAEPILLTEKETIPASVKAFLAENPRVKSTDLIGGIGVVSEVVKSQLPSPARLSGTTAYETNVEVLKAFDSILKYDQVFIANGETAFDALTGAPLAAMYRAGIVLTNGATNEGTAYVSSKLSSSSIITTLGGTAVVPDIVRRGIVYTPPTNTGGSSSYSSPANDRDTTPPVLQLIGSSPASLALGATTYPDPGAVATDNVDGNLTASVKVTGTVNTSVIGSNNLIYSVSDKAGNLTTISRTVNVVSRLDPTTIPQFVTPLLIPWAMPKSVDPNPTPNTDYYEIAMRQFKQQILPSGLPMTTVWGYGSTNPGAVFNAPSLTIEATANKPVRIKWINDLKDANGNYLPHLLPIDQTLEWANPPMGEMGASTNPLPYVGPVPIVTHVHGAHVVQESDGFPDAWYMPDAKNIPTNYSTTGMSYGPYKQTAQSGANWTPGSAVYDYTNDQRDSTIWYHDHAMGMTRNNVYAGPAGFYLIRGNPADTLTDSTTGLPAVLPGPAPLVAPTATSGPVYEIPIALQDRAFNSDGSLYYPDSREEFDGYEGPYSPVSDIAPIWNPEFFGDTIIANGNTWPTQNVEPKRYRLRFLNGSQARTFVLKFSNNLPFTQIGSDGGFLAAPTTLPQLLMAPAERADVIVDFTGVTTGTSIILNNVGPDAPYNGEGQPPANPATTGRVMEFKVIASNGTPDLSTNPANLILPAIPPAEAVTNTRQLSLNEMTSSNPHSLDIGPQSAMLGTVTMSAIGVPSGIPMTFDSTITENVALNSTEVWEIYNFTEDAHPIHLHLVEFQVMDRQVFDPLTGILGTTTLPNSWETGFKDTVIALPGQITRIKAKFDKAGLYVWHCHILEHEDNEMMRPYLVK